MDLHPTTGEAPPFDRFREANKVLWQGWTEIHETSTMYGLQDFLSGAKKLSLHSVEREELGSVEGKSLLHLQCHFGMDTLSWAKLGAVVTGADFSERAIELARRVSREIGVPANFVLSDLYDLPNNLSGEFDIVYTSYGVLGWLPDIPGWARVISHFLKPGGTFYIIEIHPFAQTFNDGLPDVLQLHYPYFQGPEPLEFEVRGSYADFEADFRGVEYNWNHTLGEIVNSLIAEGLQLEYLHEFDFCAWAAHPMMKKEADGYWHVPDALKSLAPFLFSLKATKQL